MVRANIRQVFVHLNILAVTHGTAESLHTCIIDETDACD